VWALIGALSATTIYLVTTLRFEMTSEREVERAFRQEFRDLMPNVIWQNDDGVYEVFGRYRIQPRPSRIPCVL
jgi:hypothetical protein